jgi:hypothetical protein
MIPTLGNIAMAQSKGNPTTDAGPVVKPLVRRQPYHPDHLVPANPNPGDWKVRYIEALRKQINLDSPFFVRMVEMPSFEGESSLRLSATNGTRDITKVDAFVLTFYQADTSIWYSMPENNQEKIRKQVVVSVKSAPLPKATALRVHAVWERMIQRVRKPEQPDSTLDGVSYEFATQSGMGESHNPGWNRQSPDRLVALGQSLKRYCEVKASQRKSSLEMIEIHLRSLEEYLDGHPMK